MTYSENDPINDYGSSAWPYTDILQLGLPIAILWLSVLLLAVGLSIRRWLLSILRLSILLLLVRRRLLSILRLSVLLLPVGWRLLFILLLAVLWLLLALARIVVHE